QANEAARLADRGVGHAEPETQGERIGEKHEQERRRWRDHEEAKDIAIVEQTKGESLPRWDRPRRSLNRRQRRHQQPSRASRGGKSIRLMLASLTWSSRLL